MVLTDRDVANTAKIRESTDARSNAHAVSIALSLTGFIVDALRNGDELMFRLPNGEFRQVYMTELANVARAEASASRE